jgi:hypothetical protein
MPSRNNETLMLAIVKIVRRLFLREFLKANGMYLPILQLEVDRWFSYEAQSWNVPKASWPATSRKG